MESICGYIMLDLILSKKLGTRRPSSRCIPHLLTIEDKSNRISTSKECFRYSASIRSSFCSVSLTWTKDGYTTTHQSPSNTRLSQFLWAKRRQKTAKAILSAHKVMTTVIWARDTININQWPTDWTSSKTIWKKRQHLAMERVFFQQNNTSVYTCRGSMAQLIAMCHTLLPHPPYSPDVASSDYLPSPFLRNTTNLIICMGLKKWRSVGPSV